MAEIKKVSDFIINNFDCTLKSPNEKKQNENKSFYTIKTCEKILGNQQ